MYLQESQKKNFIRHFQVKLVFRRTISSLKFEYVYIGGVQTENVLFTTVLFGCTYTGSKGVLFNNTTGCVGDDEMLIIRGYINIGSTLLFGSGQRKNMLYT